MFWVKKYVSNRTYNILNVLKKQYSHVVLYSFKTVLTIFETNGHNDIFHFPGPLNLRTEKLSNSESIFPFVYTHPSKRCMSSAWQLIRARACLISCCTNLFHCIIVLRLGNSRSIRTNLNDSIPSFIRLLD